MSQSDDQRAGAALPLDEAIAELRRLWLDADRHWASDGHAAVGRVLAALQSRASDKREGEDERRDMLERIRETVNEAQWHFDDNCGGEDNVCYSCGWRANKDRKHFADGLAHKPDCVMPKLLAFLDAEIAALSQPKPASEAAGWVAEDEAPESVYDAAEKAIKPYADLIPPQCDSHGRDDVMETADGDEVCGACSGDGFSGELGTIHADTIAIEVVAAIWKAIRELQAKPPEKP